MMNRTDLATKRAGETVGILASNGAVHRGFRERGKG